jgi:hypothetical protein
MTVASGRGLFVAEVGRKMPEAVFYGWDTFTESLPELILLERTNCAWLKTLDQDAVEEWYDSFD